MRIETRRLILREFVQDDWPAMEAYQRDERYWRFYERGPDGMDRHELLERLIATQSEEPRRTYQLAVTLKDDGRLIGNVGARLRRLLDYGSPDASFEADIGYELDPSFWGQGLATEAAGAMVDLAFQRLDVHRVWAYCLAENEPSWRLLERLGFTREGRLRENEWMQGRWWGTLVYGLLRSEWEQRQSGPADSG